MHTIQIDRSKVQLPRLSDAAHEPGAADRSSSDQQWRFARRHRRGRNDVRRSRAEKRDLRRDGRRAARHADRCEAAQLATEVT